MLQMRLVYTRREMARLISFEFMNRQLVWTAFTEFLLFLVPLINLEKMKNRVLRLVVRGQQTSDLMQLPQHICVICHSNQSSSSTTAGDDASMGGGSIDIGVGGGGDVASCTIHIPYITNCGHVYCYYCLR